MDVVALGELLIDFAALSADADGYPTMAAHAGGAPANFLAALTAYGTRTALLGKVGADRFGELLVNTLSKAGIETKGIVKDERVFTTLAFVTLDPDGDRRFSFARKPGADTCLSFEELELSLIDQGKVFHFGSLSLTDDPARTATKKAVAYAKAKGKMITYDPNLRLPLWQSERTAREQILWGLEQADVVKISEEEVEFLFHCSPEAGAQRLLEDFGVKLAMVTLGAEGAYLRNPKGEARVPSAKVTAVDTTGAGDIFGGSAVSRILKLGAAPEELTAEQLRAVGAFAATAAGLSTERSGGIPSIPAEKEVLAALG